MEGNHTAVLPYLKPRNVLATLLKEDPWLLLGGLNVGQEAHQVLKTFWATYKAQHPTHRIFGLAEQGQVDLAWTIPIMLHGDGGRTVKKQPLEVISMVAVLGLDMQLDLACNCHDPFRYSKTRQFNDPLLQKLNNRNNSYLSHFLLCAFPSKKFKKTPGLLKAMLKVLSDDIARCCADGLLLDGYEKPWHVGVIGLRGDAEWHSKTGVLSRSYQNVGHKNQIPCCHLCDAGSPNIAFEDFTKQAAWKQTLGLHVPWTEEPPYSAIPFEPWDQGAAGQFFRHDPMHVFRLGVARNFAASVLILLCNGGYFDSPGDSTSVVERLGRAWSSFSLWCQTVGKSPASMRSFSKEKLHFPTTSSFPFIGCKASDTVLLLKFLRFFAGLQVASGDNSEAIQLIKLGCQQGLEFGGIHRHGLWLIPSCRDHLYRAIRGFCHTYSRLASIAFQQRVTLFGLVPKAHAMGHLYHDFERVWQNAYSLNPGVWDCSASEDFVGRVSRQSRRISYRHVVTNTLLAYKVKCKFVIQRFKKTRGLPLKR